MNMSAYTVLDSVNKYRHGVLLGNYVEDKFGKDLETKDPNHIDYKNCKSTAKDTHNIDCTLYKKHQIISQSEDKNNTFYQTAKGITGNDYKRPEGQSSYNIFHQQEVHRKVPLLENNPKKEERQMKEGQQYANTRYYLANKFCKQFVDGGNTQKTNKDQVYSSGLTSEGVPLEEIPDILTGQIWKGNQKVADRKKREEEAGESGYGEQRVGTKINSSIRPQASHPYSTTSIVKPQIVKFQESEYRKQVLPNQKGEHRDVLFGHGLSIDEFQRNQLCSTYDLSYNQKVKPQTQVDSFYNPDHLKTSKKYHHQTVFEKTHQSNIPEFNDRSLLSQEKWGRPYEPYTKTFDKNHLKNEYLRAPL